MIQITQSIQICVRVAKESLHVYFIKSKVPRAHSCVAPVVIQCDSRSSLSLAARQGNLVLYLIPLL